MKKQNEIEQKHNKKGYSPFYHAMNEPMIIASKIYNTTIHTYPLPLLLLQLQFGFPLLFVLQEFEQAIIAPPYVLYIGTKYNN